MINKKPKVKKHQYNLRQMEDAVIAAYRDYKQLDNEHSRTELFKRIKEITYAILITGSTYKKFGIDYEYVSYEYAVYLFERILTGGFTFTPRIESPTSRFPLNNYIRKNVLHIIFSLKNQESAYQDILTDMDLLLEDTSTLALVDAEDLPEGKFQKKCYAILLMKSLRVFYTHEQITRLLGISLDLIRTKKGCIPENIPTDIYDFSVVLISLAKRLTLEQNINRRYKNIETSKLEEITTSSIRSTVFLSSVVTHSMIPKELLLSLDMDSLYRLIEIHGGKMIRVPTMTELENVIAAAATVGKMIVENKSYDSALKDSKKNLDLTFSCSTQQFISRMLDTYDVFRGDKKTQPVISLLSMSISALNDIFKDLMSKSEEFSADSVLQKYIQLSSSFASLAESLATISTEVNKQKEVKTK